MAARNDRASEPGTSRLDQALVDRGLARSRTHAQRRIQDGEVRVDGVLAAKPGMRVNASSVIDAEASPQYVSRAAAKLLAGLDAFGVDPAGRVALDVGASTGGFSQVLLERAARDVIAIDVGHDQLAPELADEPRLHSFEGVNARELDAERLDALLASRGVPVRARDVTLAVADLSFISLRLVLEPLRHTLPPDAELVVLVKPQFEVGRQGVRGGIVTDPEVAAMAVEQVLEEAARLGLETAGLIASPIAGTHGNRELVAHMRPAGPHRPQWSDRIRERLTGDAA